MATFAKATKENGLKKCKVASDGEEEEDGGYLMKELNDHLHNGGESFAALKKCM